MPARALRPLLVALLAPALALSAAPASPAAAPLQVGGRVSTEGRSPVAAAVELVPVPGGPGSAAPPTLRATPGPDGSFSLTAPAPGLYRLRAEAPGHAALEVPLLPVVEDVHLPLAALRRGPGRGQAAAAELLGGGDGPPVWLPAGLFPEVFGAAPSRAEGPKAVGDPVALAGRVLDAATRRPLAQAVVWFLGTEPLRWTLTGRDGTFSLPVRPAEHNQLEAAAAGHVGAVREKVRPGEVVTLLLEPAAALAGVVVDAAGRPIAGAALHASPSGDAGGHSPRDAFRRATSGAGGRFRFPRLLPRQLYEIAARHDEHAPGRLLARTPPSGASAPPLRMVLGSGQTASGRVIDSEGNPIAGVEVSLARVERPHGRRSGLAFSIGRHGGPRATTDAAGRFRFRHLEAGEYDLSAARQGFAAAGRQGVEVPVQAAEADLGELVLEPGVVLAGRVTGAKGVPVAGAHVAANPSDWMFERWSAAPREPVVTDGDGVFRIGELRPGQRLQLHVDHPDYAPLDALGVEVPTAEPLAIELRPRGRLAVRVVGPEGEPIAGATVSAVFESRITAAGPHSGSSVTTHGLGRTDGEGSLVAHPQPGQLDLEVVAAGYETRRVPGVEVPAGGEARPVEVALRRSAPRATLVGRIVDHLGQPLPGFTVHAERVQGPADSEPVEPLRSEAAPADADGGYRIEDLPAGRYVVQARGTGPRTVRGAVTVGTGTARLDLVVAAGVEVSGRVMDAAGNPFPGAAVRLQPIPDGYGLRTASAADGSFLFEWVPDGIYRVVGQASGYADATAPAELRVAGAAVAGIEVVLGERSGAISGRILGVEPDELTRVWVRAHGRRLGMAHARPSPDGRYRLADLLPGTWEVRAGLPDGTQASGTVRLEPGGAEATLDLELMLRPVVSGRATFDGWPLAGAEMRFQGERPSGAETAYDGSFRLRLAPGPYILVLLEPRQGIGYSRPVEVGPDGAEVTIDLVPASLSGRVLAVGSGAPLEGAVVTAEGVQPGLELSYSGPSARTDAAGLFELPRLAPGHYRLTVSAEGFAPATTEVELPEGRTVELEVPLAPAGEVEY
ncbi:MAG TPA: carboxypeptidase-like regulatory domain-containing protein [Thermoanaerobaculia bacterium]|nr:carboxypeptidase-like regulatory domain-containing protein [Thermoanaerobaculia bacterium]